ncbi:MAG: hypothetical protein ACJ77K_08615 [Bacteroidia bacterium]
MILYRTILLFTSVLILTGCNNTPPNKTESPQAEKVALTREQQEVADKTKEFLTWYKTNFKEIAGFDLVPNANGKDTLQYRVDPGECEKLIEKLSSSGDITKEGLEGLRSYFKKCDENMRKAKQNDGPPEGLDGDLILCTQEINESLAKIETAEFKDINITGDQAKLTVSLEYDIPVYLIKENNSWKIDKICRIGAK